MNLYTLTRVLTVCAALTGRKYQDLRQLDSIVQIILVKHLWWFNWRWSWCIICSFIGLLRDHFSFQACRLHVDCIVAILYNLRLQHLYRRLVRALFFPRLQASFRLHNNYSFTAWWGSYFLYIVEELIEEGNPKIVIQVLTCTFNLYSQPLHLLTPRSSKATCKFWCSVSAEGLYISRFFSTWYPNVCKDIKTGVISILVCILFTSLL